VALDAHKTDRAIAYFRDVKWRSRSEHGLGRAPQRHRVQYAGGRRFRPTW